MNRKKSINAFFIFITLVLFALPLIMTFNNVLTKFVENVNIYRLIQNLFVPIQVKLISLLVYPFSSNIKVYASSIAVNNLEMTITWNYLGWQSILLFIISLMVGLQGNAFTWVSKIQAIVLGLFGVFWVNIFRMTFTVLLAVFAKPIYKIVFHDYLAAVTTIIWLFVFWWFSYKFILEEK